MRSLTLPVLLGLLLLLLTGASFPAVADTASDMKTVGNTVIYMGLLPTEMIRGRHTEDHPEAAMHGGPPSASRKYHVVIALFDSKTNSRIENADIRARVSEIGLTGEEKTLEPMQIAGTMTYGNYFSMAGKGPFRIRLTIHIPGQPQEIIAEFEHRHQ